jgi:diguanylate cyclase (GGDEF)-like protein
MRRSPLTTLLAAIVLLSVGIGVGVSEHSHAEATLNGSLATRASQQAEILDDYFSRARSIDLLTANNPAFAEFYQLPGTGTAAGRDRQVRTGGPILDKANRALGYLEKLFPDSIGEACFIDRAGPEVARVVRGVRATPASLSPDESANPFFKPTFALRQGQGQVYQARPYVSPDTKEWVISNSTLMPTADGRKRGIVHFEITIESFRQHAAVDNQVDVAIVDADTGAVVIDSRLPQRVGARLGRPDDLRFRSLVASHQPAGRLTLGDRPAAYQRAQPTSGNANHWYVVAVARTPVGRLYGVGILPIGLVAVALLLLAVAGASSRAARRVLVHAATTDALTGLGNHRKLTADLDRELAAASPARPLLLMLFDLNGFKAYNDTFGHPAGDSLLARLGAALRDAMQHRGSAYRLGGDEFCILAPVGQDGTDPTVAAAEAALTEHGDGFSITASYGAIVLPEESRDAAEAMRLVDQRMYAQKASGRRTADRQSKDVLLRALYERNPDLAERFETTARLVGEVAQRMGLPRDEQHQLQQAAELHDIGKVAIPDAILHKPGPLDDEEWAFVRRHTLIGQRIIGAAPALTQAATLVRSTHERFDGGGYPDGLAGEQIPLGSRIIAACDAFTAMTHQRPYAPQLTTDQVLAELHRCAGEQFDPQVVAVLARVVADTIVAQPTR